MLYPFELRARPGHLSQFTGDVSATAESLAAAGGALCRPKRPRQQLCEAAGPTAISTGRSSRQGGGWQERHPVHPTRALQN